MALNTIKTNLKTNLFLFLFSGYVVLESSVKLKNEWSDDLYDSSSDAYKTLSQNYTEEVSKIMQIEIKYSLNFCFFAY